MGRFPRDPERLRRQPLGRYRYVRLRWRLMFALIDAIGAWVFKAARTVRRCFQNLPSSREKRCENADPRAILVIQLDHLGDAILSTGMLAALKRRWPEASLEVLVGQWNRALFEAMPCVDRVHVSRVNRFSRTGRFGWIAATFWWGRFLRRRKIDLGIDARGEFPLALILWLCGAKRRVGWTAGGGGFLLTDHAAFVPNRHETESRRELLRVLGVSAAPEDVAPTFVPSAAARAEVAARLDAWDVREPYLVLHIGAGTPAKTWPDEHWRELIGRLIVRHGRPIVLVGSPAEQATARAILDDKPWPGVIDATGRLNIVELAALLEHAEAFVGADSGPAHLAAAVGAPVVALFSGTNHADQWRPLGRQVRVLRHAVPCSPCHCQRCRAKDHPCMSGLSPERVAEEVARLIEPATTNDNENRTELITLDRLKGIHP